MPPLDRSDFGGHAAVSAGIGQVETDRVWARQSEGSVEVVDV